MFRHVSAAKAIEDQNVLARSQIDLAQQALETQRRQHEQVMGALARLEQHLTGYAPAMPPPQVCDRLLPLPLATFMVHLKLQFTVNFMPKRLALSLACLLASACLQTYAFPFMVPQMLHVGISQQFDRQKERRSHLSAA